MWEKPCWIQYWDWWHDQSHSASTAAVWWWWASYKQHQGTCDSLEQGGPTVHGCIMLTAPMLRFWPHCVPDIPLKMVAVCSCYHNDALWWMGEKTFGFAKLSPETSAHFLDRVRKMGKFLFSPIFFSESRISVKKLFEFLPSLNTISLTFASIFKEISFLKG